MVLLRQRLSFQWRIGFFQRRGRRLRRLSVGYSEVLDKVARVGSSAWDQGESCGELAYAQISGTKVSSWQPLHVLTLPVIPFS